LEIDKEKVIDYRDKSIFDERKVENNGIDYRLPNYSSNPANDQLGVFMWQIINMQ